MDTNPAAAGFSASKLQRIGEHLQENYIQPGKITGCQVMVSRHGTPAYFQSLGEMDRERGKPVADDTIFRIYSMTKPITSIALMMLFEEGRFQLNDPVYRFLPAWRGQQSVGTRQGRGDGNSATGFTYDHAAHFVPYRRTDLRCFAAY